eukprot:CAMPEP_0174884740 /NCGR_PEP_ID=MMETSP0167-20121228/171_1 /TAXON_ID=38298 /ORGANISM="Rhodella maculata, Strain CCMP736" /LENGTH=577 /DNA_ID=CAMNT_0016120177 /DNA_START=6 /DNA_END=1739 /DNA_ORIENTATION=-
MTAPRASLAVVLALAALTAAQEPDPIIEQGVGNGQPLWHLDYLTQCEIVPPLSGAGTTIFIVDTGCLIDHNEFKDADISNVVLEGYDPAVKDPIGSGTHMASLIVGKKVGIAKDAKIVCIRVYDDTGKSTELELIAGINLARDLHKASSGPSVLLMTSIPTEQREQITFNCYENGVLKQFQSLCVDPAPIPYPGDFIYPYCNEPGTICRNYLDRAMENAAKDGMIAVTSAGNNGGNACEFSPSRIEFGIKFGAIEESTALWTGSNSGDCVDAYAPGVNVTGAWSTGNNAYRSDRAKTSSAAALGAAIVARILEENAFLDVDQVRDVLVNASKPTAAGLPGLNTPCEPVVYPEPTPTPVEPTPTPVEPTPTPVEPTPTPVEPTPTPVEPTPTPVEPTPTPVEPTPTPPEPTQSPPLPTESPPEPTQGPVVPKPTEEPTKDDDDEDDCTCDDSKSSKDKSKSHKDKSKSSKDKSKSGKDKSVSSKNSGKDSGSDKDDSSHDVDRLEEEVERHRSPRSSSGKGKKKGHYKSKDKKDKKNKKCTCKKDKKDKKDKKEKKVKKAKKSKGDKSPCTGKDKGRK